MNPKQRQEQLNQDLRNIMASAGGRRWLWSLLNSAGLYAPVFNHSGSVTAYNSGRQSVAQEVAAQMASVSPDDWVRIQAEAANLKLTTVAEQEQ